MYTREGLWGRMAGPSGWVLAWATLLSSALPWLLPETWDGSIPPGMFWAGWALVLVSLLLLRVRGARAVALCAIVVWATCLGLSRLAIWETALPKGYTEIEGVVSKPWQVRGRRLHAAVKVQRPLEMGGMSLPLSVPLNSTVPPQPGTPVRFRAELRPTQAGASFLPERLLWRARNDGTPRQATLASALVMETLGPPEPGLWLRFRCWILARFQALPIGSGPARDLWGALALGINPVNDEVTGAFSESGTLHLLVVSGLQITLIMATLEALLRKFLKRGPGLCAIAGGLAFAALVGFTAPIWRGLLMGVAWVLGRAQGWKAPPALALHLALLIWLILRPASGCAPGFLLGWWAMLGLIWAAGPLQGIFSPLSEKAAAPLARVAAPWCATLPLLALFNGGAPAWGILTNLAVLPFVWVLLPLCLGLTLFPIDWLVLPVASLLDFMATQLVPFFAKIVPLATGILWPWIALLVGWLALAQLHATMKRCRALALCLLGATVVLMLTKGTGRAVSTLTLDAPDLGDGEALLLRVPGADATLIDAGPTPWSARRLVRAISRRGVREPIHLVVTHPHADHAGGWAMLERLWPTETTRIPPVASPETAWVPFAPNGSVSAAILVRRGDSWSCGDAKFSVMWPPKAFRLPDPNMLSMVLCVDWRGREMWFMGDALAVQERDLIDLGDLGQGSTVSLLKAGHHGSDTATCQEWVDALSPKAVLFVAESDNRFGFPFETVLDRCRRAGAEVLVTGPHRGLQLEAIGDGWTVHNGIVGKE